MKKFFRYRFFPFVAGFVAASAIMMLCEYVNHLIFAFPPGMDTQNFEEVQKFTESLPDSAFLLVLVGWLAGSLVGGYTTSRLAHERAYRTSLALGIVLTLLGAANNLMIGHTGWFNLVGLPLFLIGTYAGHTLFLSRK